MEQNLEMENNSEGSIVWVKYIVVFAIGLILLGVVFLIFFNAKSCGDETSYGECSSVKPYFCLQGKLVERASLCGCGKNFSEVGEECFSEYKISQKNVSLKYIFEREWREINFNLYEGFYNYTSNLQRFVDGEENFSRRDFKLKVIENSLQREFLLPLVVEIQNLEEDKKEQVEIVISLVQNIEYDFQDENTTLFKQAISSRYPYEVLYEGMGVCGEKSELLAFLLKELGYGVVIFYFPEENHEAVGIKCGGYKDFENTGYCYVETTGVGNFVTPSSKFEVIKISDGRKF